MTKFIIPFIPNSYPKPKYIPLKCFIMGKSLFRNIDWLGTQNDKIWADSSPGSTPNMYPTIYLARLPKSANYMVYFRKQSHHHMSIVHPLLYTGDKIEFILKITTVHCVTWVVGEKTCFNNICKFPRNNPIQNPPFSFSNAQTSTNLDADFRLIYWIEDGLWTEHTKLSITSVFGAHCYTATDYGHMKAKSLILWGPNLNPNPEEIFEMWI